MSVVGFDGAMPAMFGQFFFRNGKFTYGRRTDPYGVLHRSHGEIEWNDGTGLIGDMDRYVGDGIDSARRNETSAALRLTVPGKKDGTLDIYLQNQYLAQDNLDVQDTVGKADFRPEGDEARQNHLELTGHSETRQVGELDFARTDDVELLVVSSEFGERIGLTARLEIGSREGVPPVMPEGNVEYDLASLTEAQKAELNLALQNVPTNLALTVLQHLPPEMVLQIMNAQ
jgi:hypothetical protein